jgi:hypothetical protein
MLKNYWFNQAARYKMVTVMNRDKITALGASLRWIDQTLLSPPKEEGAVRVWYQGGEPYFDVFVDLRDDQIEWFQFTFRGKSLSWHKKRDRLQTGVTNELAVDDVTYFPASKVIENDTVPDADFIKLAHAILQSRAGEEIFDKILKLFKSKPE